MDHDPGKSVSLVAAIVTSILNTRYAMRAMPPRPCGMAGTLTYTTEGYADTGAWTGQAPPDWV